MSGAERRRNARVALAVDIDGTSGDNFFTGKTRDISVGGLYIETDVKLDIGRELSVHVRLMDQDFSIRSEVMWVLEGDEGVVGVGVQFVEVDPKAKACIDAYMEKNAPLGFHEEEPDSEPPAAASPVRKGPPPLPRS